MTRAWIFSQPKGDRAAQESELQNYRTGSSPNKTLQHVCGNEELCFCVQVICRWPPPTSLPTWLGLSLLLMFGCFLLFLFPPTHTHSTLEGNTENKRNPTPSLPRGPPLVMAGWPHSGGCGVTRAGKISCVKTQNDRNGKRKRMKSRRDVKKNKWRTNSCCTVFKKPMPGLDWGSVCVSARVSLAL